MEEVGVFNAEAMLEHAQLVEEDVSSGDYDSTLAILISVFEYAGRLQQELEEATN